MESEILVVGASVRAAAQSALRAGLRPVACDQFADEDLAAVCPAHRIDSYPSGLIAAARLSTAPIWMYTGALENAPAVIEALSREKRLLGNDSQTLHDVRDPWKLARCLGQRDLPFPAIRQDEPKGDGGEWIRKPFRSGGGIGIQRFVNVSAENACPREPSSSYFQQFVSGTPLSGVYVGAAGRAVLLGITRQLVGSPWGGPADFVYVGSIGPLPGTGPLRRQFDVLGSCIAERFGLNGLFGIDVLIRDRELWTVEVNPRYTASVEILERALGFHAIKLHVDACTQQILPPSMSMNVKRSFGKATVYANGAQRIGTGFSEWVRSENTGHAWPAVADIPARGSQILAGHPICTVFAEDESVEIVEAKLQSQAKRVRSIA